MADPPSRRAPPSGSDPAGVQKTAYQRAIEELDASLPEREVEHCAVPVVSAIAHALLCHAPDDFSALRHLPADESAVREWAASPKRNLDSSALFVVWVAIVRQYRSAQIIRETLGDESTAASMERGIAIAFFSTEFSPGPPPAAWEAMRANALNYLPWEDESKREFRSRMDRMFAEATKARGTWRSTPKVGWPALHRHVDWFVLHRVCGLTYEDIRRREPLTATKTIRLGVKKVEQAVGLSPLPRRAKGKGKKCDTVNFPTRASPLWKIRFRPCGSDHASRRLCA